jgi:hypothetical protein
LNVLASIGAPVADESTLFDGRTWERLSMRVQGMTLDNLATLASQRQIGKVTILRDLSYDAFLGHLQQSNSLANRYIADFDRQSSGSLSGISRPSEVTTPNSIW